MKYSIGSYENAIGGFAGGMASTLICHPMDLLKIRFSANEGSLIRPQYSSYADAVVKITRSQGFRGLYQGLMPNLIGGTVAWGAYFQIYHWLRSQVASGAWAFSSHLNSFSCAFASGAAVMCVTNPIWLTKTRLCLQYETQQSAQRYRGMTDCIVKIVREEGFRGLYKGFVAGVAGASHGALQMMLYSHFKDTRCQRLGLPLDAKLSKADYLLFSFVSKVIATSLTFPYQVIRTRMQDHNAKFIGVWKTLERTVKGEGMRGLYKGLLIANVRTLPATVITFITYEEVRYLIRSLDKE